MGTLLRAGTPGSFVILETNINTCRQVLGFLRILIIESSRCLFLEHDPKCWISSYIQWVQITPWFLYWSQWGITGTALASFKLAQLSTMYAIYASSTAFGETLDVLGPPLIALLHILIAISYFSSILIYLNRFFLIVIIYSIDEIMYTLKLILTGNQ